MLIYSVFSKKSIISCGVMLRLGSVFSASGSALESSGFIVIRLLYKAIYDSSSSEESSLFISTFPKPLVPTIGFSLNSTESSMPFPPLDISTS